MPRRCHRSQEVRTAEAFLPLIGVLVLAWIFSPQFRVVIVTVAIVVIGGLGIALVVLLMLRKRRNLSSTNATGASVNPPSELIYTPRPLILPKSAQTLPPPGFTPELLSMLEWRRFEILTAAYFQKTGYLAIGNRVGADGGVDIILTRRGESQPCACVQCKAWNTYKIGVKPVRELFGVMAADKIPVGYFVTSGEYTSEALDFAQGKPLTLISGRELLFKLSQLSETDHADILREVTAGDYTTPTCPHCDIKMVERKGPTGPFWGCRSYPKCRQSFRISEAK